MLDGSSSSTYKLNIKEGDIKNCIKVRGSGNLYYEKNVTRNIIKTDSLSKHLIYDNLLDELKIKFDFQKLSIYQQKLKYLKEINKVNKKYFELKFYNKRKYAKGNYTDRKNDYKKYDWFAYVEVDYRIIILMIIFNYQTRNKQIVLPLEQDNIKEHLNIINIQIKCKICTSKMTNKHYHKVNNKIKESYLTNIYGFSFREENGIEQQFLISQYPQQNCHNMQLELQITFIIDFHSNKLYIMKNYVIKRWTMENSEYSVFKFIFIFCNNFEESLTEFLFQEYS
ncbi:hypothetical protein H8356DRAFT_1359005 [Neocallimastix lanati (nom. inval.)]|nr:hypothetical protein H8356DRAFT_1359005 [Neocallimastix sp. JGI-2020a]